jgi:hypothetical protein
LGLGELPKIPNKIIIWQAANVQELFTVEGNANQQPSIVTKMKILKDDLNPCCVVCHADCHNKKGSV